MSSKSYEAFEHVVNNFLYFISDIEMVNENLSFFSKEMLNNFIRSSNLKLCKVREIFFFD